MRKLFIIITLIVVSLVARAQVYDGITQPTKFRIFMPVTTSLHGNGSTVAPFVGYRADVAKWLSVTQVLQYNMTSESVSFGAWLNVNYQQRFLSFGTFNVQYERKDVHRNIVRYYKTPCWVHDRCDLG